MKRKIADAPPPSLEAYEIEPGKVLFVHQLPKPTITGLTATEEEVLALLLDGHDNASIAAKRMTAVRTIANQVASIFRKVGVSSRAELVARISESSDEPSSK